MDQRDVKIRKDIQIEIVIFIGEEMGENFKLTTSLIVFIQSRNWERTSAIY